MYSLKGKKVEKKLSNQATDKQRERERDLKRKKETYLKREKNIQTEADRQADK